MSTDEGVGDRRRTRISRAWVAACGLATLVISTSAGAAVRAGDEFPALTVTTWDDAPSALPASSTGVVIVEFWASWCVPCHDALPALARLATQYKAAGLRIVLVDVDTDHAAAERELATVLPDHSGFELFIDKSGEALARLGAPGMPSTYLVVDGVVQQIVVGFGGDDNVTLEAKVRKLLSK